MQTPSSRGQGPQSVALPAPAILIFGIFYYRPLLENAYISFFQWNMISPTMKYVGLRNYQQILSSAEMTKILGNTPASGGPAPYIQLPASLWVCLRAFPCDPERKRPKAFFRSAFFLPSTISLAVASIIFLWMYNPLA